jgi:hypothetical protein
MKERLKELLEVFYPNTSHEEGVEKGIEIYTFSTMKSVSLYCESFNSQSTCSGTVYSLCMTSDDVARNIKALEEKLVIDTYIEFQCSSVVFVHIPQIEEPVLSNFKVANRLVGVPINDGDEVDCVEYWCEDLEVLGASKEQLDKIEKLINEKLNDE